MNQKPLPDCVEDLVLIVDGMNDNLYELAKEVLTIAKEMKNLQERLTELEKVSKWSN